MANHSSNQEDVLWHRPMIFPVQKANNHQTYGFGIEFIKRYHTERVRFNLEFENCHPYITVKASNVKNV